MDFYAENIERLSVEIINTENIIDVYNRKLKRSNLNTSEYKELKTKINTLKNQLKKLYKVMDII